ncbi:hypothetical protein ASPWEDRAFT_37471 [Aspergillus wentii DTO 134E9]|uniref:HMG box domain-containing protein n=1 Tax=Aspergillus wentii DTO 134E9 TaxID=1073089 RepID=A0A1L9RXT1_ASPWE|nr:uncharacterized protein ASPWEDRAFT_37471 [Aspergillus wentii DTO 134E9]KAI9931670.1 hypothetical protein MW887_010247 [Aspergillus wentii]OJJ39657.1 hypothetical protein ASPWEDRAFT_37471 [Aspergillus wentii DTO 134E9]
MSRKDDSKPKEGHVSVNVDDFTRTRDNVIMSLAQLQSAVSDLSRAYITHANTVLGRSPAGLDIGGINGITQSLFDSGLLGLRASSPGAKSEAGGDKKKRKRAPPDPNAPKRALTPYFLYMQHNRTRIAEELGGNSRPKDVADEGTRRWADMPEPQKEVWKKLYADNLAVYKEKVKAYKAGLPVPDDDNARASSQLQQDVAGAEASADESEQDEDEEEHEQEQEPEEEEEEEVEESPEPVKEPTPPRSSAKRRRSEGKPAAKEVASPTVNKKESPKKKRTSARTQKDQVQEEDEQQKAPSSARKPAADKRTKKKRKSEAGTDE